MNGVRQTLALSMERKATHVLRERRPGKPLWQVRDDTSNNERSDLFTLIGRHAERENRNHHCHTDDSNDAIGQGGGEGTEREGYRSRRAFREKGQKPEFSVGRQDRCHKARKVWVLSLKINLFRTTKDLDKCGIGIDECFLIYNQSLPEPTLVFLMSVP